LSSTAALLAYDFLRRRKKQIEEYRKKSRELKRGVKKKINRPPD
jgi:hypothetical protein